MKHKKGCKSNSGYAYPQQWYSKTFLDPWETPPTGVWNPFISLGSTPFGIKSNPFGQDIPLMDKKVIEQLVQRLNQSLELLTFRTYTTGREYYPKIMFQQKD